jgi:hypothetical protein
MRSATAAPVDLIPSLTMLREMKIAATASAHQSPKRMPTIPSIAAPAVIQSALFISASAQRILSCRLRASGILARPSSTAGSTV